MPCLISAGTGEEQMIKAVNGKIEIGGAPEWILLAEFAGVIDAMRETLLTNHSEEEMRAMIHEAARLAFMDEEELDEEVKKLVKKGEL